MRTYTGRKKNDTVTVSDDDMEPTELDPRFDLRRHSPCGFAWGYGGSGPAQLALALLVHVTGDQMMACKEYQFFKREVIARIPTRMEWEMDSEFVSEAADVLTKMERVEDLAKYVEYRIFHARLNSCLHGTEACGRIRLVGSELKHIMRAKAMER